MQDTTNDEQARYLRTTGAFFAIPLAKLTASEHMCIDPLAQACDLLQLLWNVECVESAVLLFLTKHFSTLWHSQPHGFL